MDIQRELSDDERAVVARRLLDEQRIRFNGIQKAAYTAAGVNPATWSNAISGTRVRPDRLIHIVRTLWPESGGRWDLVPEPREEWDWPPLPDHVAQGPWTAEVENAMADVDERFVALETRVRVLEARLAINTMGRLSAVDDELSAAAKEGGIEDSGEHSI